MDDISEEMREWMMNKCQECGEQVEEGFSQTDLADHICATCLQKLKDEWLSLDFVSWYYSKIEQENKLMEAQLPNIIRAINDNKNQ